MLITTSAAREEEEIVVIANLGDAVEEVDNESLPLTPSRSAAHSLLNSSSLNTTPDDDTSTLYMRQPIMKLTDAEIPNLYVTLHY
jgi:hypothetical protein